MKFLELMGRDEYVSVPNLELVLKERAGWKWKGAASWLAPIAAKGAFVVVGNSGHATMAPRDAPA